MVVVVVGSSHLRLADPAMVLLGLSTVASMSST
jgi:hypothetical protein